MVRNIVRFRGAEATIKRAAGEFLQGVGNVPKTRSVRYGDDVLKRRNAHQPHRVGDHEYIPRRHFDIISRNMELAEKYFRFFRREAPRFMILVAK